MILATTSAGLVVHSRARAAEGGGAGWVRAPHRDGAFVVNFGELLSQVTNERWPATRHYAVVPPLSPAELEAPWLLHGGLLNYGLRQQVTGQADRDARDSMIRQALEMYMLFTAAQTPETGPTKDPR